MIFNKVSSLFIVLYNKIIKEKYDITGMSCAACSSKVEREVSKLKGMDSCQVNLLTNSMKVEYDENELSSKEIIDSVVNAGYGASLRNTDSRLNASKADKANNFKDAQSKEIAQMEYRLKVSFVFLAILMYISMGSMIGLPLPILSDDKNAANFALTQLLLVLPVMYVNRKYYINGFKALFKRSPNMDSLIAVGSSAAFVHGIVYLYQMSFMLANNQIEMAVHYKHNLYFESISMILTLVTLGKYFETKAKSKTTSAITKLLDLAPDMARVLVGQEEKMISTSEVEKGNILIVKPGESIPVDGIIIEGTTSVDESAITGESIPVSKTVGDKITGATINKSGFIKFRATEVGGNTTISKIIALVEEASSSKAPISKLADKVAGVFVPIVMCISLITLIVWLILGENISFALSNAIAVLVISCPCALGLATPVAIMVATGKGAELGILIKSADALETTYKLETIVLDKTGTLTKACPTVANVIACHGEKEEEMIRIAACLEEHFPHSMANAVVKKAADMGIIHNEMHSKVNYIVAHGISTTIDVKYLNKHRENKLSNGNGNDIKVIIGSRHFVFEDEKTEIAKEDEGILDELKPEFSYLFLAIGGKLSAIICIHDPLRDEAKLVLEELKKLGIKKTVMITGDNEKTARSIAEQVGIDEFYAEVLPDEKADYIRNERKKGNKVIMIGDGINDSLALSEADCGIAISEGAAIAREVADVTISGNNLMELVVLKLIANRLMERIHNNYNFIIGYNASLILLGTLGILPPKISALLHNTATIGISLSSMGNLIESEE